MLQKIKLEIYGESHGKEIGMRLFGIPKGCNIDTQKLQSYVDRRKSTAGAYSTQRGEPDIIKIRSGIENGTVTGDIDIYIENTTKRRGDYEETRHIPRPSHADYPVYVKYGGACDMSGGGRFSGRLTAPLVIAGGIASEILFGKGITVGAYIAEIGGIKSVSYKDKDVTAEELLELKKKPFPVRSDADGEKMLKAAEYARAEGDSLGGVTEVVALGVPVGLGDCLFDGLESKIAYLVFGIPAVKGIEFGAGFDIAAMKGSDANDCYRFENGNLKITSNNSGGILGGMSDGMPITLRVAFKPVPSVAKPQNSVNLLTGENVTLEIKGRHDACFVPRAVPATESALALALLDCIL